MENLEFLLEEKNNIKQKIQEGLSSLASWFQDREKAAANFFTSIKNKVSGGKADSSVLNKLKSVCDSIMKACRNGLKAIKLKDNKKALSFKDTVLAKFEEAKGLVKKLTKKEDAEYEYEEDSIYEEDIDFESLMEQVESIGEDSIYEEDSVYEEEADFDALLEEFESAADTEYSEEIFEEDADFESLLEEIREEF